MRRFPRPVIVVSRCLDLEACRYNAQMIRAPVIRRLEPYVDLKPVCPEVEIGLGVPRDPIRLVAIQGTRRLVQPSTGRDVTDAMRGFGTAFLKATGGVDGFILKSRSPSCGIKDTKVYGRPDAQQPTDKGAGLFGEAVLEAAPFAAIEDEGRLTNFRLRHHFLTKAFMRAGFREAAATQTVAALVRYQTVHKLQLMAYGPGHVRSLGRVVAVAAKRPVAEAIAAYEEGLGRALARPARPSTVVDALQHAFGYVSAGLSRSEKRHFLELLDRYRAGRVTLAAPLALLQSWAGRFGEEYLAVQTLLEPYPQELMDLADSGRS